MNTEIFEKLATNCDGWMQKLNEILVFILYVQSKNSPLI